jgi:hypothetical protein
MPDRWASELVSGRQIRLFVGRRTGLRFEGISGRINQGAGLLFNLKPNGDYLTIRANPLENNLVLWKFEKGKRSSVTWIRNTPTTTPLALIQTRPKTFRSQAGFGFSSWPLFR